MNLVRIIVLFSFLFNLSACTDCGEKSFIYGSCDISQNSQSSAVKLLVSQSKRHYITEQEDWKRKVDFSGLAGDSSQQNFYCYFMESNESGYDNANKELCSNVNDKYHLIDWDEISDSNYRENYIFVVEALNLETGKTDAIASFKLKDEFSHIKNYVNCDFEPSSTSLFVNYLKANSSANSSVCLKEGSLDLAVATNVTVGADNIKVYGREPAPNSSEKPPKIEAYLSSDYLIKSDKLGFEMHGVVLESTKAGMSTYFETTVPVQLSFINARGSASYAPESFLYMSQTTAMPNYDSVVDSVNLKLGAVKHGIIVKGGHEEIKINNLKMQLYSGDASTTYYGIHLDAAANVRLTNSSFDIMSLGHAVKMASGKLYLSKNEFIQRVDNKELFLIVDGGVNKEIELAGNHYIRKDESTGSPDPIFQVTSSDGVLFKQSLAKDGTSREWACHIDDSIASFSAYIGIAGAGSISSRPGYDELNAFQSESLKDCSEEPDPYIMSNASEKWDNDSYGFQGNGWVE
ncbi:MAG: hypothetical protein CL674_14690 [Bdellovibrionaceae bacterium]|nr:hypothetical protein [Pseudobdellovibrionaceae bacterium]|tara:strand:- start:6144 stop:7697 length:1554 start_codon:yes stop_codon:yes gene_type:complete